MHQIHFGQFETLENQKKGPQMIDFFPYGDVNTVLGAVRRPNAIQYTHKRQFSHLWQIAPNDVNSN